MRFINNKSIIVVLDNIPLIVFSSRYTSANNEYMSAT